MKRKKKGEKRLQDMTPPFNVKVEFIINNMNMRGVWSIDSFFTWSYT